MSVVNRRWVEAAIPEKPAEGGYPIPKPSDFKLVEEPAPSAEDLAEGEVVVRAHFLSPDPYIVSMIMVKPEMVGQTVWAGASGKVVASKSDALSVGDIVVGGGSSGCQEYFKTKATALTKLPQGTPLSAALGVCGMPGVTAYLATSEILGTDLSGQTIVVTGAAGAVGSAAAQVAKLLGASTVIGLAGSDAKCAHAVSKFGIDHMLNYKSPTLKADLEKLGPFHGFYDNTGGPAAKLIKALLVEGAPVAKVGSIGGPSETEHDATLKIQGFYAGGCRDKWPAAIGALSQYVASGQIKYDETVLRGILSVPEAFIRQRTGKQLGKMIVDLRPNRRWIEASIPVAPPQGGYPIPKPSDFELVEDPVPTEADLAEGEALVKSHFLSPDPYIVSFIMVKPEMVGQTVWAGSSGEVIASKSDQVAVGDLVVGQGPSGCQEYFKAQAAQLTKLPQGTPLSAALGVCGMPGVTAYLATTEILGEDLTGKTIVVTGAAGAVGSAAAQLAKLLGASKVIGLAGTDEKCAHATAKFGIEHMLNYKSATLQADLEKLGPFHGFYDNTGGPAAVLIKALLVDGAPVAKVGAIGGPSASDHDARIKIQGFYAGGCVEKWPAAILEMSKIVSSGQLQYDETVLKGIEAVPEAFIRQRTGKQLGKMIVDLR